MDVKKLYEVAGSVACHFTIPGYDTEDLIQECVIKGLSMMEMPTAYIRKSMRNLLIDILRRKEWFLNTYEKVDGVASPPKWYPIPKTEGQRKLVYAMLVNHSSIKGSAKFLGISRFKMRSRWADTVRAIKDGECDEILVW